MHNCVIILQFNNHIVSSAAEVPVEFQSDAMIQTTNIGTSRDLTI